MQPLTHLALAAVLMVGAESQGPTTGIDWQAKIAAATRQANETERVRRVDYYRYLVESGRDAGETLAQHLATYADYATVPGPASADSISGLARLSPVQLPDELVRFYRSVGGFHGGGNFSNAELWSPTRLIEMHNSDRSEPIRSIGLVDMIRASRGNDCPEFDGNTGNGLTAGKIAALNASYAVIGWRILEQGEAFEYLYVDRAGGFGVLLYHQDYFESLYEEDLELMLAGRRATLSLEQAIEPWLTATVDSSDDE